MKNKTLNVEQIWKQFEDSLAPRLGFSVVDRAVYSHLLRHCRLEGKARLRFSILWLARKYTTFRGAGARPGAQRRDRESLASRVFVGETIRSGR